jgi:hypothetical protein
MIAVQNQVMPKHIARLPWSQESDLLFFDFLPFFSPSPVFTKDFFLKQ